MRFCIAILFVVLCCLSSFGQQESIDSRSKESLSFSYDNIHDQFIHHLDQTYSKVTSSIRNQSEKLLHKMQRLEAKLQTKLEPVDSIQAAELFSASQEKYRKLQNELNARVSTPGTRLKEYIPGLDSITTAVKFLHNALNVPGLSQVTIEEIKTASLQINELQNKLQNADEIQNFIQERIQLLKTAIKDPVLTKYLSQINKQAYYYQQQLNDYKTMLHDPDKIEQKALEALNKIPAFQKFWQKNSYLAQLFPVPQNYGTTQALTSLQARSNIEQTLMQRLGNTSVAGSTPQHYVTQQIQTAESQLSGLKEKINKLGGGSSDMAIPDFKPNNQRTRRFFKRLQYGFNIQSQQGSSWLPSMSDFALMLGYKLSDNKIVGIGVSYKVGWKGSWNHVHVTNEGIGLRGFADIKTKKNLWLTAGWEYNYLQRFNNLQQVKNIDAWQKSALAGLTKKYRIGKKRDGNIQLLYDFLAKQQVPQGQILKFRIGYNF